MTMFVRLQSRPIFLIFFTRPQFDLFYHVLWSFPFGICWIKSPLALCLQVHGVTTFNSIELLFEHVLKRIELNEYCKYAILYAVATHLLTGCFYYGLSCSQVKKHLVETQQRLALRERARQMREKRKFGKQTQLAVLQARKAEKRRLTEAIKASRKKSGTSVWSFLWCLQIVLYLYLISDDARVGQIMYEHTFQKVTKLLVVLLRGKFRYAILIWAVVAAPYRIRCHRLPRKLSRFLPVWDTCDILVSTYRIEIGGALKHWSCFCHKVRRRGCGRHVRRLSVFNFRSMRDIFRMNWEPSLTSSQNARL